jgi:ElaB/YqjD/DUF883 family membrane-anchored ribosome-binding protein
MELYFRDLISAEASLEKLVDDLMLVVQGRNVFADGPGAKPLERQREELTTLLMRLKDGCRRLEQGARSGARSADKTLRRHPYSSLGCAFVFGLVAGALLNRRR